MLSFSPFPLHTRMYIVSQMLPDWRTALRNYEAEHEPMTKDIPVNGKYKTYSALPLALAVAVVEANREVTVARLRQEIAQLQEGIDRMDATPAPAANVYDGAESGDELDV